MKIIYLKIPKIFFKKLDEKKIQSLTKILRPYLTSISIHKILNFIQKKKLHFKKLKSRTVEKIKLSKTKPKETKNTAIYELKIKNKKLISIKEDCPEYKQVEEKRFFVELEGQRCEIVATPKKGKEEFGLIQGMISGISEIQRNALMDVLKIENEKQLFYVPQYRLEGSLKSEIKVYDVMVVREEGIEFWSVYLGAKNKAERIDAEKFPFEFSSSLLLVSSFARDTVRIGLPIKEYVLRGGLALIPVQLPQQPSFSFPMPEVDIEIQPLDTLFAKHEDFLKMRPEKWTLHFVGSKENMLYVNRSKETINSLEESGDHSGYVLVSKQFRTFIEKNFKIETGQEPIAQVQVGGKIYNKYECKSEELGITYTLLNPEIKEKGRLEDRIFYIKKEHLQIFIATLPLQYKKYFEREVF